MKTQLAEYKMGGISFFIPCNNNDEFIKDIVVNQQEDEDFENGSEEMERFNDWFRNGEESLLREQETNYPH